MADGPIYTRGNAETILRYGSTVTFDFSWIYDYRSYIEWPIFALERATLIANPIFRYEGHLSFANSAAEINPLTEKQPSDGGCTDVELYGYIASGISYVKPFTQVNEPHSEIDLGASAKTDLQAAIDAEQSWFAIGFQSPDDEGAGPGLGQYAEISSEEEPGVPPPTLYVQYTLPPFSIRKSMFIRTPP